MVNFAKSTGIEPEVLEEHEESFYNLPKPPWLVEGELRDSIWIIQSHSSSGYRFANNKLLFDSVVATGKRRLSLPEFRHDYLTAKIYVYYGFSENFGWNKSSLAMSMDLRALFTFFRWKYREGIPHSQNLSRHWFDRFVDAITSDEGMESLLDPLRQIEELLRKYETQKKPLPVKAKSLKKFLSGDELAQEIGFQNSRQLTGKAREVIRQYAAEKGLSLHGHPPSTDNREGLKCKEKTSYTSSYIARHLYTWGNLYKLNPYLKHDALSFEPFKGKDNPGSTALSRTKKSMGRTVTPPAYQVCYLLDRSIRWVLFYSTDLKELYRRVVIGVDLDYVRRSSRWCATEHLRNVFFAEYGKFNPRFTGSEHPGNPWPLDTFRGTQRGSMSLQKAVFQHLATACAVVIATFSARRGSEILALRDDCIKGFPDQYSVEVWIQKTIRTYDQIPVPNVVAEAIYVLKWMSSAMQNKKANYWIFYFEDPIPAATGDTLSHDFNFRQNLDEFSDFIEVPKLENGKHWAFRPHQFRRFFAITYYYRFRHPSLTALTDFFRHFDPDMTRRYITEAAMGSLLRLGQEIEDREQQAQDKTRSNCYGEVLREFNEEALQFRCEVLRSAASGQQPLRGFGGEWIHTQLEKAIKEINPEISLGSSGLSQGPTLEQAILRVANRIALEPNGLGHSYCKCGDDEADREVAGCLQPNTEDDKLPPSYSAPNPQYAADHICSACPHNVQLPENKKYWELQNDQITKIVKCGIATPLKSLLSERLDMVQAHLDRCFGAKPGKGQIDGETS